MINPSATARLVPHASASANSSASVKTRSISGSVRSSIETTSVLESRAISVARCASLSVSDHDRIGTIDLGQAYVHPLTFRRLDIFAYIVRANGQLVLAAIHQHGELNRLCSPQVSERVKRGAHRAPGVQNIIDQHDPLAVERKRNIATEQPGISGAAFAVIAIRRDVEGANRDAARAVRVELDRKPLGQAGTAPHDADEREVLGAAVALADFMRDPLDGARYCGGVHGDLRLGAHGRARKKTRLRVQPG